MQGLIQFTERFGSMVSRALLTALYYLALGPFALFYQRLADPLHLRRRPAGNWVGWGRPKDTLRTARKQD